MIWTSEERNEFAKEYVLTCKLFDKEVSLDLVKMLINDLQEKFNFTGCFAALKNYRNNPKNKSWPKLADILAILSPELSVDSSANESANRIRQAITKFGWPDPNGARSFIGDVGWAVVLRFGGWQYVCENHGELLQPTTFHAQARDSAKSIIEMHSLGVLDQPIQLEQQNQTLQKLGLIKLIQQEEK